MAVRRASLIWEGPVGGHLLFREEEAKEEEGRPQKKPPGRMAPAFLIASRVGSSLGKRAL